VEVTAYYVVAEALTNTTKHARASYAEVIVDQRDSTLWVCVRDDGVGGAETRRGSGLIGLHDRVEAINGTVDLTSPAGQGTLIQVSLPLQRTGGRLQDPRLTTRQYIEISILGSPGNSGRTRLARPAPMERSRGDQPERTAHTTLPGVPSSDGYQPDRLLTASTSSSPRPVSSSAAAFPGLGAPGQ